MLLQMMGPLLHLGPIITLVPSTYVNEVWLILRHYSMWSLVRDFSENDKIFGRE